MAGARIDDLVLLLRAPAFVLGDPDGQVRPGGPSGMFVDDRRLLSRLLVRVDGREPAYDGHELAGPGTAVFSGSLPGLRVRRTRRVSADGLRESVELSARTGPEDGDRDGEVVRTVRVEVEIGVEDTDVSAVKAARHEGEERVRSFAADVELRPGRPVELTVRAYAEGRPPGVVVAPAPQPPWTGLEVLPTGTPLARLLKQSLADLDALRLADAADPGDELFAAGAPWYLTLFGRDSLWAARMTLPLGTAVAAGTLRALARRQGRRDDVDGAEAPGKILHELRRTGAAHTDGGIGSTPMVLPGVYYGTVDATALWVLLLHDAWRWGLDPGVVEDLLPALEAALAWHATSLDERGFLSYQDASGHGLANQGWKDSPTAVRFPDGRVAEGPIALAEVQAYAHEAALAGSSLLEAFGRPGAERYRELAAGIADRFRAAFWVADDRGPFPAMGLDGDGRPVATVTSNIGHLLGTGLLTAEEEQVAGDRLLELSSGYGLRTMTDRAAGYDPLSYHCGSVWTHDTAIAIENLARSGAAPRTLTALVDGLLAAAQQLDHRMPELYSGGAPSAGPPAPYPSSCRPQAWAAAAGVAIATALAGVRPDVPGGGLTVEPPEHRADVGAFELRGVRVREQALAVSVRPGDRRAEVSRLR